MDKIMSARLNESVIQRIGVLAKELHTTKKAVIEAAILTYSEQVSEGRQIDILEKTFGAWRREESPEETIARAKSEFKRSMMRHY